MPAHQVYEALRHWRRNSYVEGSEGVESGEDFAAGRGEALLVLVDAAWLRDQVGSRVMAEGMVGPEEA